MKMNEVEKTKYVEIDGYQVPVIPNIHQRVYTAASVPGALDMMNWHSCGSTHCRAGWVIALAGEAGWKLAGDINTPIAARLIYRASDKTIDDYAARYIRFYCSNEEALKDMKRLAEQEMAWMK